MKPGYKQTEVGVIPEAWEVKPLSAIADKIMVGIASAATHAYRSRGVPMFRNQNIKPGHLDDNDLLFIAPEYEATFKNKRLRGGDLLTMRTGYPGVTAIVPARYNSAQSFTTLITRPKQGEAESPFLCHFINSESGQRFFTQSQIGGAQKNVNVATLRKMPVPLPKPAEQRAIAEALSDVDGLLGGLDRLIAKKRDLKQAAMQQLLTGQTRLPGFNDEWEQVRLGDLFSFKNGLNKAKEFFGFGTPIVNYMDVFGSPVIRARNLAGRVSLSRTELRNFDVQKGDVFFTRTSETAEEVGMASVMLDEPTDTAHDLVIRATDVGVCPNKLIPRVLHEWREPRHDAFQPRNVWSLFNAFTEALKGNLIELPRRTEALHGLLDTHVGLDAPSLN